MATAVAQRSFAGGELAPSCYARTDLAKYASGARAMRNMVVQRHGGATNRPGLVFIAAAKDSALAVRLKEFVFDATDVADTYLMEFGNGYIRFVQDGGQVVVSSLTAWVTATAYVVGDLRSRAGVNYYCTTAHTSGASTEPGVGASYTTVWVALEDDIFEVPTPYQTADLPDLNFVQSGDVVTIVHPDYPPRNLTRVGHTNWRLEVITFGPSIEPPTNIGASSAGAAGNTYYAVTAVKASTFEESLVATYTFTKIPTSVNPVTLTWNPVAGAISYNVYRSADGATYGLLSSSGGLPGVASDGSWADSSETATGADPLNYTAAVGQLINALSVSATARAYDGVYTVRVSTTLTPSGAGDGISYGRYAIFYSRDSETPVFAKYSTPVSTIDNFVSGPTASAESFSVPDNGYTTLEITIVPEAQAPSVAGTVDFLVDATAGTVEWTGQTSGFVDDAADPDYSIGPPTNPALFTTPDNYPRAVTYYQQRRVFASTRTDPEKAWASRTGSFNNFSLSTPLQDDDAITFTLAGKRVNAIRHLLDLGELVMFGTSAEQRVNGDDSDILRPDSISVKKISANGSGRVGPLEVDDSAVYLQGRGSLIRDLKPLGFDGYQGTDLTIFAAHLFNGYEIVDWAYQHAPNSVIWAVRSDGVLLGLTYIRDQAVWGWHRHDTTGTIENVCVVPEGDEDAVYVLVAREIDGATVRYIERMAPRYVADSRDGIFMDSALSYDGRETGVRTITLSSVTGWASTDTFSAVASASTFTVADIGKQILLESEDGDIVRCTIEGYTSVTNVTVRPDRTVPVGMRSVAIGNGSGEWALAVTSVSGLDHLEGESLSVVGDAFVVASPNAIVDGAARDDAIVVSGGAITLPRPYAVIHAGLPYISDLETLDLDMPGSTSVKAKRMLVSSVIAFVESSRGVWAGRADKVTDDAPLAGLYEYRPRSVADSYDTPTALLTEDVEIRIDSSWNTNGRVLFRQVDPLPLTILAAIPVVQA